MIHIQGTHKISKLCICLGIFLISVNTAIGQSTFIKKDTTTYFNVKLLKSTKENYSNYISQQKEKDTVITLTPTDIDAFGLKDGRVFYAFGIDSAGIEKRYFFEQVYTGKYDVYFLHVRGEQQGFYFSSGENLPIVPIPKEKKDYIGFLDSYLKDCEQSRKSIRFLDLSKARIIRLMQDYENCEGFHLPRTRLAFSV